MLKFSGVALVFRGIRCGRICAVVREAGAALLDDIGPRGGGDEGDFVAVLREGGRDPVGIGRVQLEKRRHLRFRGGRELVVGHGRDGHVTEAVPGLRGGCAEQAGEHG